MERDAFALFLGGGMAKPVATDCAHGRGQDMAQVASDELDARKGFGAAGIAAGPVFPRERDGGRVDGEDAGVADGGAADVGSEILDGAFAVRLRSFSKACRPLVIVPAWRTFPVRPPSAMAAVMV